MKVDVIVIGSGIAGLAIAAALGRQKLKALVIGPDIPSSNFDYEYIFENSTITSLPAIETFDTIRFSGAAEKTIPQNLHCVDSKSLYQRFLMVCADNGVAMMHGRAETIVSYRKLHRVDWVPNRVGDFQLPKEELFASLVIDASGTKSPFSPKSMGFSSTLRKIVRGSGELFGKDMSYVDFLPTHDSPPSFCRGFKHEDGSYFIDEVCLYSHQPLSEEELSVRLSKRLNVCKFTIKEEVSSNYHCTPLFSDIRSDKILSFGDAAAMANPMTGEATSRIVDIAPRLAKIIAQSIDKTPKMIADVGRETLFSEGQIHLRDAFIFLAENTLSSPLQRNFLEAIFSSRESFERVALSNTLDIETFSFLQAAVKSACSDRIIEAFSKFKPHD